MLRIFKNLIETFTKNFLTFMKKNSNAYLHIDMDSFFATVEQQANPFLRGRPIGVIGNPHGRKANRSVIAAASKEAKKLGVKSGMPPHKAKILCPSLVLVPADGKKYNYIHQRLVQILKRFSSEVRVLSIDEAVMKLEQEDAYLHAEKISYQLKKLIRVEIGETITCSIGVAPNITLAKIASEQRKPDGLMVVPPGKVKKFVNGLRLEDFPGIGPKTISKLNKMGIATVKKLAHTPLAQLLDAFGVMGESLKRLAQGQESRWYLTTSAYTLKEPGSEQGITKSIGHSHTTERNIHTRKELEQLLLYLAEKVGWRLRQAERQAGVIRVCLRWSDFTQFSKQKKLGYHTDDTYQIFLIGRSLLREYPLHKGVRLLGVTVAELRLKNTQTTLFNTKRRRAYLKAQDQINKEYGKRTIVRLGVLSKNSASSFGLFAS